MGSRREARRAGKKAARNATWKVSVAAAAAMLAGSFGSKPNKNWPRNQ